MFLDIEMVIWIDAPDPEKSQVDAVDRKNLCEEHPTRIGNKLGHQRNNVNRWITQGEELINTGPQLVILAKH